MHSVGLLTEAGNVIEAEAISGHPLFRQVAQQAALQWKFRPTLLNGIPIRVTGVLIFNFHLGE
ncbi:MAG: energy transducer TonB [Acidobacteriota bacterium]|nr:energy transducer TonB [Acidobacteriota bacterium]